MKRLSARLWLLVLLCCFPFEAGALEPDRVAHQHIYDQWLMDDGLPQSGVASVCQTEDGYLWLATQDGLARYDGREFVVFDKYNTPEFRDSQINALEVGAGGALWIGTNDGLIRFKDGSFERFDTTQGLPHRVVTALAVDGSGGTWAGTKAGLARFHKGEVERSWSTAKGLFDDEVRAVVASSKGVVWVASGSNTSKRGIQQIVDDELVTVAFGDDVGRGVATLWHDVDGTVWAGVSQAAKGNLLQILPSGRVTHHGPRSGIVGSGVRSLFRDRDRTLWIGTEDGDLVGWWQDGKVRIGEEHGLKVDSVESLFEDLEGSLWVGTSTAGLVRVRDGQFRTITVRDGLPTDLVWSVYRDRQDRIWVGSDRGVSVVEDGRVVRHYGPKDGLLRGFVGAIHQARDGSMWVASDEGLSRIKSGRVTRYGVERGLRNPDVRALADDGQGGLWIGSHGGGLHYFDGSVIQPVDFGDPNEEFDVLFRDSRGRIWAGGAEGPIMVDGDTVRSFDASEGFTGTRVFSFYEDPDGLMWIGTSDGLYLLRDGVFRRFSVRDGLFDDRVYSIVDDGLGFFWVSCNKGVSRIRRIELLEVAEGKRAKVDVTVFGTEDGMRSSECNFGGGNSGALGPEGTIWFPSIGGVVVINPKEENSLRSPPVVLEKVLADGVDVVSEDNWVAPRGVEDVEFHFGAPSFIVPEKIEFEYRLVGLDEGWVRSGTRRVAHYAYLQPGDYRFEVKSSNKYGKQSREVAYYAFTLTPEFHQTRWFYAAVVSLLVIFVGMFHRLRVQSFRKQEAMLARLVRERTQQLERANRELVEQSFRDPLTGLRNRRFLLESMGEDVAAVDRAYFESAEKAEADEKGIVFAMVDLDHFKSINDSYGHVAGDRVLVQVADILKSVARQTDSVVRWGGEEFLLVARGGAPDSAAALSARIRKSFRTHAFDLGEGVTLRLTCSIGFACYPFVPSDGSRLGWEEVVGVADKALYAAKRSGRDAWVGVGYTPRTPEVNLFKLIRADAGGLVASGELRALTSIDESIDLDWE
ncbi:MAG: two-component regulator propeller domain-containing protein [Myxococcota bacterium]|nr:two-component regulator propeller domain-containing protein [Myxococcota bacterium]